MELDGMHVGILAAEGVEDLEFWVTVMRLREEGARVTSIGLAPGRRRHPRILPRARWRARGHPPRVVESQSSRNWLRASDPA